MQEKTRIGWIGTGVMGASMAGHLLKGGYPVSAYNRTRGKAQALLDAGARWMDSPLEVARASDIVFTIVGYPHDVEETILGEKGVLSGLAAGGIVCDMTTSSPALAERIARLAEAKGCAALDAPVTGGDVGARGATLSILVGGDAEAFKRAAPCLELMGRRITHFGKPGMGQQAKLANQVAVAGLMFSVCESLLYAQEAGLDARAWLETVSGGAAGSTALNNLGPRILDGNFAPGFYSEHFLKDLELCVTECRRMKLVLPGLAQAEQLYRLMVANGRSRDGTQALILALAALSGREWNAVQ
ncbi:MAG: NAD(P)-dependent oxidoreductase [Deltaproteobacteria bacterium]|jgi:3-hydroxyisobutyrate dehydrogenase|nr:NAD(P)-dependent oxidoreductase [Deltaproteobacteria bacterium]